MANPSRRLYTKPPIVEAIVEIRVPPGEFDEVAYGDLYSLIKAKYPNRKSVPNPSFPGIDAFQLPRIQFRSGDESALVQVGNGLVSCNSLRYPGWETFKADAVHVIESYLEISKSTTISRIGVRYVNRFSLPSTRDLNKYFNMTFNVPAEFSSVDGFRFQVEASPSTAFDGKVRLVMATLEQAVKKEEGMVILLDIDCFTTRPESFTKFSNLVGVIERAHQEVETVFEGSITDENRASLGVQK
jgi:uncharacterized protein (TIGR04255 family)